MDVTRAKVSVFYKKDKALLTIKDRNTNEKFICKSPVNIVMGIGELFIGLVLASNPVGWVIVVVVVAAAVTIITHSCTSHLQKGKWINFKETVYFNGHRAITQSSMLMCDSGGIYSLLSVMTWLVKQLKPFWEN